MDNDAEATRALIWAVRRRKYIFGAAALAVAGGSGAWAGLGELQSAAEERVLRRQASVSQSRAVRANGVAVEALGVRVGNLETAIGEHAEMTRLSVRLLVAHPELARVLAHDTELATSAARIVAKGTK